MPKKDDRIIIDTNLWISFLLTKDFNNLDSILADRLVTLIVSQELLEEFVEVSQRSKFRKYFSLSDMQDLLPKIRERSEFIDVKSDVEICRDPKDNFLLALAKDGEATHLITGDNDLLILQTFGTTRILTMPEYLSQK